MARIRSVHPGLFTDEIFFSLSDAAQVFLIGLWTEADDQGLFEWKPLTLKMRLRAASNESVEPLLVELAAGNAVRMVELNGKKYGAIRNFRKFQRPKYPNAVHPINDDIRKYVGLTPTVPEVDSDDQGQFPQNAETAAQVEDVVEDVVIQQEPIGSVEDAPKRKPKRKAMRFFTDDEPLDPEFYAVACEYPSIDVQDEWEKCRDYHLQKNQGTGSIKGTARTWCRNAVTFAQRSNFRVVK